MVTILLFLIGLAVGSFLNVLIDRLPKGETVLWGRSHCDHCHKILQWYELIPVLSFAVQRGRCRHCRKRLSVQYPIVELVTAVSFVLLFRFSGSFPTLVAILTLISSGIVIAVADAKYQIIPDSMIVAGAAGALVYLLTGSPLPSLGVHVLTGLGTGAFFYLLWLVTKGRGMGFGDVKLAFVIGFLLGVPMTIFALYAAFLTGASVGVILILGGQKTVKSKIAFGPFLVLGVVMSVLFQSYFFQLWNMMW